MDITVIFAMISGFAATNVSAYKAFIFFDQKFRLVEALQS